MSDVLKPVIDQLKAYNSRDIDQFMMNFSEDCVLEDAEGNLLMAGYEDMYASYKKMFEASPDLHCLLASRVVVGNYILDEERVTGRNGDPNELHVVAAYRVEGEKIVHVRFFR